ncbi:MAG TPA: PH domain-containing protein [Kribbellaceae bacterium]|nr:PH domain-containing protein [Kribbellaceae bacterium]
MGISAKLLGDDERIVTSTRTHWKALIGPVLVLLVVVGGGAFLAAVIPEGSVQTAGRIAIAAIAVVLLAIWVVKPFLDWFFATYTLTNRRMITRHGILNRSGRDIPLVRINDVSYEHGLVDRMLRCGTLVIQSASDGGQVVLRDVPHVERLHLQMSDLLFGGPEGKPGDGLIDGEDLAPGQRIQAQRDASTLFSSEEERPPR